MSCEVMAASDCPVLDGQPGLQQSGGDARNAASAGGLGYSRHYAQRIRDLGRSSKDGWIKRLWNHMFGSGSGGSAGNKKLNVVKIDDAAHAGGSLMSRRTSDHDHVDRSLPYDGSSFHDHATETCRSKPQQTPHSSEHKHELTAQRQTRSVHELAGRSMPPQLLNSPYLPPRDKVVYYRPTLTAKPAGSARDGVAAAKLRYQRLSKSSTALRSSTVSHVDASDELRRPGPPVFVVKRQFKRDTATIQMEKRAKAVADRAIMVCHIVTAGCSIVCSSQAS